MSDISSLVQVFQMEEITKKKRVEIIIRLGTAINNSIGGNITECIVWELVESLDPDNKIFMDSHYFSEYHGIYGYELVRIFWCFFPQTRNRVRIAYKNAKK